jgi:hypothetical protein
MPGSGSRGVPARWMGGSQVDRPHSPSYSSSEVLLYSWSLSNSLSCEMLALVYVMVTLGDVLVVLGW